MDGTIVFSFVFFVIMGSLGVMMLVAMHLTRVVKAGDVHEFAWRFNQSKAKPSVVRDMDKNLVSTKDLQMFRVEGDSMKDYKIHSGNRVLVEKLSIDKKQNIQDFPVIVFSIETHNCFDGQYKLRKFICYVDDVQKQSWETLYDAKHDRIKKSKEEFVRECVSSVSLMSEDKRRERLVLSETYNTTLKRYRYSLHRESAIFGRVKYVLE